MDLLSKSLKSLKVFGINVYIDGEKKVLLFYH